MSLTNDLLSQLQGAPLQQVSQQLGIDSQQASGAISAALPLLMGALGNNAAQPQGAQALLGALQNNHSGLDIGSVLGAVLGDGGADNPAANGAGILGHIFGGNQGLAETGLAQATGLSADRSKQLLAILAPIVMAFLAKQMGSKGQNDAAGLGQLLGQEQQAVRNQGGIAGGLLGQVLDQDGDGQLGVGDLIKLGSGLLGSGKR